MLKLTVIAEEMGIKWELGQSFTNYLNTTTTTTLRNRGKSSGWWVISTINYRRTRSVKRERDTLIHSFIRIQHSSHAIHAVIAGAVINPC